VICYVSVTVLLLALPPCVVSGVFMCNVSSCFISFVRVECYLLMCLCMVVPEFVMPSCCSVA